MEDHPEIDLFAIKLQYSSSIANTYVINKCNTNMWLHCNNYIATLIHNKSSAIDSYIHVANCLEKQPTFDAGGLM